MQTKITIKLRYKSPYKYLYNFKNLKNQRIHTKHHLFIVGLMEILLETNLKHITYVSRVQKSNFVQILRSPNKHKSAQFHTFRAVNVLDVTFDFDLYIKTINIVELVRFFENFFKFFENSLSYLARMRIVIMSVI